MALDPASHRQAWHARTPSDPSVSEFAAQLEEAGVAEAGAYDPTDGIHLGEGELIALVYNPDLRLARLRSGVARATADHAGRWDDPVLSVDLLRITEGVSDPWILASGLAITLPISGRLEAEQARADADYQAKLYTVFEAEWRIKHEVRMAWLTWSAATVKLEQQEALITTVDALVDTTKRLADAGEIPRTEAGLFAIEHVQRRHELRRLRGQAQASEQRLRSLMGLSPKAPLQLIALLQTPAATNEKPNAATPANNPSLNRLAQVYEVAEQQLHREIRKQYPDLTIGPVFESDEGQSRIGLSGGIPIPILNTNRKGIAEAKAERALAQAEYETEYERLVGSLAQARSQAQAHTAERQMIADELAPLVDRQVSDARRLLDLGEGGSLVLLESLVRAHATKLNLIEVRLDEARAYATQVYLAGPDPQRVNNNVRPNPPSADPAEEVSR